MKSRTRGLIAGAICAIGLVAAPVAQADHHLIQIREVHRGATAAGDYIELQMFADGQNVALNTHYIDILQADGQAAAEYPLPAGMVGQNQRTILIGNTGVAGADFTNAGVALQTNGAACYDEHASYDGTGGLDCVAWGNFVGNIHPLSSPALPTVLGGVGLAPGQTLVRSISRGCPSALDAADDTNSSVGDFALGTANPRNNAATPTEVPCTTPPPKKKCKKGKRLKKVHGKKKCVKKKKHRK
jgi:hypothetical protein